jgi:CBS domain-containing protein
MLGLAMPDRDMGIARSSEPEANMTQTPAQPSTVAEVMHPAVTTVEQTAHLAAAAYLMKKQGATAIVVIDDPQSRHPIGIITEADVVRAVADGQDVNDVRIRDLMTASPTVCQEDTTLRNALKSMVNGGFRHLPVVEQDSVVGIVEIGDVSRALLDPST